MLSGKAETPLFAAQKTDKRKGKKDDYTNEIGKGLAYAEVISYNKMNLERELQNESRQRDRQQGKMKRREEEI